MEKTYRKIYDIRKKVENKKYVEIYNFLQENKLSVSIDNFSIANQELGFISNNSYCNYVYFIKTYFYNTKQWK